MLVGCHCPYCKQLYKEEVDTPNGTVIKQIICEHCNKIFYLTYNENSEYHDKE